ncbi:hypothetical protein B4099_1223 [Heyndrickxia coagulans]|jgi:hypothetical protein|uniref:Uncharacterized protein n=1 Tax=Heyndrickxia coagulans TaxID=1398 RepID=A0A150KDX7_HEYCO|nr:hypothetical protein B4099_1223 [Heyndrickxia coagulans]
MTGGALNRNRKKKTRGYEKRRQEYRGTEQNIEKNGETRLW